MPNRRPSKSTLTALATAVLPLAMMTDAQALPYCIWDGPSGPMDYAVNVGHHWIARDAEIGSVIGPVAGSQLTRSPIKIRCDNDGSGLLTAQIMPTVAVHPNPLPPVNGWNVDGKVLETTIPGVGLYIRLQHPYSGATNAFRPRDDVALPYEGYNNWNISPLLLELQNLSATYTLIKTGPIPAGPQSFSQRIAQGTVSDIGPYMNLTVNGQVQQAQCTLKSDAVSADPVLLGRHDLGAFTGVGATTPMVDFHIMLNDCEDDPSGGTARAFIRLDGDIKDPDLGLFGLTSTSGASGIAIQLLRNDGSPMKLGTDELASNLGRKDIRIDFRARYYQVDPVVKAGSADGKLNFTISYR